MTESIVCFVHFRGSISTILRHPATPACAALLISALIAPLYQYRLNPDALSYLGIAQDIVGGSGQTNAYWSPMFSWLLAPLIAAGISGLLALKLLCALCAGLATAAGTVLFRMLPMSSVQRIMSGWTLSIIAVGWSMSVTTPDLLLTAILGFALAVALHPQFPSSQWSGVIFGGLGIAAYLKKSVALPLFIVAIPLIWLAWRWMGMRKSLNRNVLIAAIVLAIGSTPWVVLISEKIGHITIGEAGPLIHASEAPGSSGLPITTLGFLEPEAGMRSVWQDPSPLPRTPWSALQSVSTFKHQIILLARNISTAAGHLLGFSVFAFALLFGGVVLAFRNGHSHTRLAAILLTGACIINVAPYLPILVDARYLWVSSMMLLGLAGMIFSEFLPQMHVSKIGRYAALIIVFGSFLVLPVPELLLGAGDGSAFARQATALRPVLHQKRIGADVWKTGLYLSHYVDATYLGTPTPGASPAEIDAQLLRANIDAYVTWKGAVDLQHYAEQQPTIPGGPRIYVRVGAS